MENTEQAPAFQAPSLEELAPLLPAYDIEAFIAQGGMGAVYQARQKSLDRPVAIKILPREFGADPAFRESFAAEAKAMAKLNHPNLIGVYDFGDIDGMLFLVMELVHGKSLYHSCYGKVIDPTQAAEIVIAICRGIDHAHDGGILHRDIKPANILLSQDTTPKIGDFGLASPMNKSADEEEVIYGTPGYTAPEVIHRQSVDRRADIFSIGVMLHELLTGAIPDAQRTAPSRISGCPIAFDAIVARSTQPNPQLRYATAGELAADLTKAISQTSKLQPSARPIPSQARVQSTLPTKKKSPALALSLLGIALVAGIAIFASSRKGENTTPETDQPTIVEKDTSDTPETPPSSASPIVTKPVESTPGTTQPKANRKNNFRQLASMKKRLVSGDRSKFPDGTVERNGSHFLALKHPLSWHKAQKFAEQHGAHLAILANSEDRKWITTQFDIDVPLWVGAGRSANNSWQWLDYTTWNTTDNPTKTSVASNERVSIAISDTGTLLSQPASRRHPIILQWRNDGSNPCTMDAQLKRTAESVKENGIAKAQYPVGTRTYQQSHFLLLERQASWDGARKLAQDHLAHIAVPTTPAENQWLASTFLQKNKSTSFWLGGYQLSTTSPWQWITKEAWHSSGWKDDQPSTDTAQNRMLMSSPNSSSSSGGYWSSSQGSSGGATKIVLEWSTPKQVTIASEFDLEKWLASVNRKIAQQVKPSVEKYNRERGQLITSYVRDMKRAAKKIDLPDGRGGRDDRIQDRIEAMVNEAMDDVEESGKLPASLPPRAPDSFQDIHTAAQEEIEKLDDAFELKLESDLEFYIKGLTGKVLELHNTGFINQARSLQETTDSVTGNTSTFLKTLGL